MDLEIEILRELQTKELRPSDLLNKLFSKLKVIEPFQKTSADPQGHYRGSGKQKRRFLINENYRFEFAH